MQGIGAAIMVPGSLAIIAKAYPKQERGRASEATYRAIAYAVIVFVALTTLPIFG